MVLEIDVGVHVETDEMSAVWQTPEGLVMTVVGGVQYAVTRFSFEQMLEMLRQREEQTTDLAY